MEEKQARSALRLYRRCATQLQTFLERYKATLDKHPELEAELIVTGRYHKKASHWIDSIIAKTDAKELAHEDWESILRDNYSPWGVIEEVIMHLVMYGVIGYEEMFIENCWKLPKWKRPDWLREMEVNCESHNLCWRQRGA